MHRGIYLLIVALPLAGAGKVATTNGQAAMTATPPQPQLTPAQAAAQAAINNGIAHQNGVVPVRTGLAWAPGGRHLRLPVSDR